MEPMTKIRIDPTTGQPVVIPLTEQEIAQRAIDEAAATPPQEPPLPPI